MLADHVLLIFHEINAHMKLQTKDIIALFQALTDLRGSPTIIVNSRGVKEVVNEPYDLGPKFKWNAAKNRNILRRFVEQHDEAVMEFRAELTKIRRELAASKDSPQDNAVRLQVEMDRINEEIRTLSKGEEEVPGLLMMPATGLNLKTSRIPPTVIEELMPLIEGEPDFDEAEKKK